jgi:hypothetical protein
MMSVARLTAWVIADSDGIKLPGNTKRCMQPAARRAGS